MSQRVTPPAPPPLPAPPSAAILHTAVKQADLKKPPVFKDDALVLYYHPYNFYSQKVLLMLNEKNIEYTTYALDLSNGEQYTSWFLKLNPKADVPVLQDGAAIIVPDSKHIINYLESKYRGGVYVSLQPSDITSKEFQKLLLFEEFFSKLPVGVLSLGSFLHDDLKLQPKPPFVGPIRTACLKNNEKIYELLKNSVDEMKADSNKLALLHKLDVQERRKCLVYSRQEFQRVLDAFQHLLQFVEADLKLGGAGREWLVGSEFTMADVSFGLLLHRLYQLGFENYYWSYGKLPHVESYFLRFRKRTAFQKLMPNNFEILKDIWQKTPANYKIGAGAGVIGMAMFAALAHK